MPCLCLCWRSLSIVHARSNPSTCPQHGTRSRGGDCEVFGCLREGRLSTGALLLHARTPSCPFTKRIYYTLFRSLLCLKYSP
ncbi:hypothetical protein BDY19DRAFT_621400 [Irpex rosettiformis]|uniref:Uncharacterized protein n=1 Tax=Irpex rosettiformis TaxID=378272 RepID=A0ACB8TPF3_9APHY|nr:hypothetical protein BDY19DRAFT_621400 [Irpex rosettiformis]